MDSSKRASTSNKKKESLPRFIDMGCLWSQYSVGVILLRIFMAVVVLRRKGLTFRNYYASLEVLGVCSLREVFITGRLLRKWNLHTIENIYRLKATQHDINW